MSSDMMATDQVLLFGFRIKAFLKSTEMVQVNSADLPTGLRIAGFNLLLEQCNPWLHHVFGLLKGWILQ